jgi:hypothetical protein
MTRHIPSMLTCRSTVICAALLALVAGCEWDYKDESAVYAIRSEQLVLAHADPAPASRGPEVATTLTAFELRQQYLQDEERRHWWRVAQADDAMRRRVRLAQEQAEVRRRWDDQVEEDRRRRELRQEQQQRQEEQRQRLLSPLAPSSPADPWRSPQPAQTLDGVLQQIQRQQMQQQHQKMLRHQNTGIMGSGSSNP